MESKQLRRTVLIISAAVITVIFVMMIRGFLMAILMAGITSALANPLYRRFERWYRGRRGLASISTLLVIVLLIIIPLGGLLGIVAAQAFKVGQSITPWIQQQLADPSGLAGVLEKLPFYEQIAPYQQEILTRVGELVASVSQFLISGLSSATVMTVNFLLQFFIFLYTLYFFLMDGDKLLDKIMYYLPLEDKDERRMLDKFTSVTRATLKGTAVIGILQGGLAGLAFVAVGIPSAVFWGTIMVVLSIIPGIGSGLVWAPAAIILAATGHTGQAIGLAVFCGLVVGSLDNILRPRLVGKDTQLPELLIFFGTLGGLVFFGVLGVVIGPIVAALFVTIWEIYGEAFKDILPEVHHLEEPAAPEGPPETSTAEEAHIDPAADRETPESE
jgi:predicted PurR-regulated permease PerM